MLAGATIQNRATEPRRRRPVRCRATASGGPCSIVRPFVHRLSASCDINVLPFATQVKQLQTPLQTADPALKLEVIFCVQCVVSPCLSNIFLHYVLDEWFENEVKPRLKGRGTLVRFADDVVMAFADFRDAERVLDVLGKRLARYGLRLHTDKTRFVDFRSYRPDGKEHPVTDGTAFTFLGFCHVWGKSRWGKNIVRQVTAKQRYARALAAVTEW